MPVNNKKEIFIGGTGRSGTSILSKHLGSHPDVYQIPFETKFLVDKDGALDLFVALTKNFNIVISCIITLVVIVIIYKSKKRNI